MKNFIFCTALISYMYQLTMNKNEITPEAVARRCSLIKGPPKKIFFFFESLFNKVPGMHFATLIKRYSGINVFL